MNSDTVTKNQADLADFISFFRRDPYLRDKIFEHIEKAIARGPRRILIARDVFEICELDPEYRLKKAKSIKNQELLNVFFEENKSLEQYRSKLKKYESLREGFMQVFNDHCDRVEIESYFNGRRRDFKNAINSGEQSRKAYLGHKAGNPEDLPRILNSLKLLPFGCRTAFDVIFDLCQYYFGAGHYGEGVSISTLNERLEAQGKPIIEYRSNLLQEVAQAG